MRFIENWAEQLWRAWSIRLAAVAGIIVGWFTAYPQALLQLVAYVPEQWRPAASVAASLIAFAVPTVARLVKQGGKDA